MKYVYKIIQKVGADIMEKTLNKLGAEGWYLSAVLPDGRVIMQKRVSL